MEKHISSQIRKTRYIQHIKLLAIVLCYALLVTSSNPSFSCSTSKNHYNHTIRDYKPPSKPELTTRFKKWVFQMLGVSEERRTRKYLESTEKPEHTEHTENTENTEKPENIENPESTPLSITMKRLNIFDVDVFESRDGLKAILGSKVELSRTVNKFASLFENYLKGGSAHSFLVLPHYTKKEMLKETLKWMGKNSRVKQLTITGVRGNYTYETLENMVHCIISTMLREASSNLDLINVLTSCKTALSYVRSKLNEGKGLKNPFDLFFKYMLRHLVELLKNRETTNPWIYMFVFLQNKYMGTTYIKKPEKHPKSVINQTTALCMIMKEVYTWKNLNTLSLHQINGLNEKTFLKYHLGPNTNPNVSWPPIRIILEYLSKSSLKIIFSAIKVPCISAIDIVVESEAILQHINTITAIKPILRVNIASKPATFYSEGLDVANPLSSTGAASLQKFLHGVKSFFVADYPMLAWLSRLELPQTVCYLYVGKIPEQKDCLSATVFETPNLQRFFAANNRFKVVHLDLLGSVPHTKEVFSQILDSISAKMPDATNIAIDKHNAAVDRNVHLALLKELEPVYPRVKNLVANSKVVWGSFKIV
ncbi:hypothetical protein NEDG_02108 [Nematocida displodere]|uniref:Uncharacterized protein n=1 Tax=Nematocida displodere TaxID=1805483 RepID=A0A177EMH9_9MICR|nr:hypothetical protein NEDG_02108 [Nematocida displodere]